MPSLLGYRFETTGPSLSALQVLMCVCVCVCIYPTPPAIGEQRLRRTGVERRRLQVARGLIRALSSTCRVIGCVHVK